MDSPPSSFPVVGSSQRPRCGVDGCNSRRFRIENGLTYCHRGHQQEGLIQQSQEYEDINFSASQTVKVRNSQKQAEDERRVLEEQSGPRGVEQVMLIFQLVLQKNTLKILREKEITKCITTGPDPQKLFEQVVRELWGMRLQALAMEGVEAKGDGGKRVSRGKGKDYGKKKRKRRRVRMVGRGRHREIVYQDDSSSDDEAEIERSKWAKDKEADAEVEEKGQPERALPKLLESVGLLYIAALCLRIPVTLRTLQTWTQNEELIYHQAEDHIPSDMFRALAPGYQIVFKNIKPLQTGRLHSCVADLTLKLQKSFETLKIPALNYHILLLDYIVRLGLPLYLFSEVEKLAKVLQIDFTTKKHADISVKLMTYQLPEMQLLALIVISAKLLFPFDHATIYAKSASDPAIFAMNWEEWDKFHHEMEADYYKEGDETKDSLYAGPQYNIHPTQAWEMRPEQADAYMDWIEDLNDDQDRKKELEEDNDDPDLPAVKNAFDRFREKVASTLPTHRTIPDTETYDARQEREASRIERLLQKVHASLAIREVVSEEEEASSSKDIPRTGDDYPLFRHLEQLDDEKWAKVFYQRVAEVAGVPLVMILRVTQAMEGKVREAKRARFGSEVEEERSPAQSADTEQESGHESDQYWRDYEASGAESEDAEQEPDLEYEVQGNNHEDTVEDQMSEMALD